MKKSELLHIREEYNVVARLRSSALARGISVSVLLRKIIRFALNPTWPVHWRRVDAQDRLLRTMDESIELRNKIISSLSYLIDRAAERRMGPYAHRLLPFLSPEDQWKEKWKALSGRS